MPDADPDISRPRLIRDGTFLEEDRRQIAQRRRGHNQLGFAYQIAFVRVLGRFPRQEPLELDEEILRFAALQLGTSPDAIGAYAERCQTVSEHQQRIRSHLKLRAFDADTADELARFLEGEALRLDRTASLLGRARGWLRDERILAPATYVLRRAVGAARQGARTILTDRMAQRLSHTIRERLDALLHVGEDDPFSALNRIKSAPSSPSTAGMRRLLARLELIEETGVPGIDVSWVNGNYQRVLFHTVRTASAARLRRMAAPRRHLALVCFLHQAWRNTLDQAVDMYGKLLDRSRKLVEHRLDEKLKAQRHAVDRIVQRYRDIGAVLLDPGVGDTELRPRLLAVVSENELLEDQTDLVRWTRGDRRARFEETAERHNGMSRFAAPFLSRMNFLDEHGDGASPTLEAVRTYREIRSSGRRTMPPDAPMDFAPKALVPLIRHDGAIDRGRWESALFLKVRDEVRAGNLAIDGAKNFGRFESFFLPEPQWQRASEAFWARTGFPSEPSSAAQQLRARLSAAFDRFLEDVPRNRQVSFDDDGWRLKTDRAEQLDPEQLANLAELHRWFDARRRSIRLADLLIEVENDLRFSAHFLRQDEKQFDTGEVCALLAAILAHGCNLGLYTMEKLAPGIPYRKLRHVSDWRLVEENQRAALASIVHGISRLDAAARWGDGRTSASDGQRFAMPGKVLQRTYSTRFNDFALEFYSFVADNYAPFYSRPIECTDRDAPFVLDGVLYHESDLDLEEHYTDTHGYTEINFAAFAMIGIRFCPRIRRLHRQRIYCADPARDHGVLEPVLKRGRRAVNFRLLAEQWGRIGQFYAAFPAGHATASAALQRLNRFQASNRFYAANRELGRVLKTEFVLQYMSEPKLRAKVRRGLLKVEQLHALARAVYYGQRGRITAREVYDQMNACSCLTLILACIVYWQAREISQIAAAPDFPFDLELITHVSPIEWKNVILYGEIKIDPAKLRIRDP